MSADHRKPVVAFVMLALAAALVVGVQHAEAQGGRLLAAAAGVGAHVQGTISSPTQTISSRGYDRLADLGPTFVSVRESAGHAGVSTVTAESGPLSGPLSGTRSAAAGPASSAVATRTRPTRTRPTRTSPTQASAARASATRPGTTRPGAGPRTSPGRHTWGRPATTPATTPSTTPGNKARVGKSRRTANGPSSERTHLHGKARTTTFRKVDARRTGKAADEARVVSFGKLRTGTGAVHPRGPVTPRAGATSGKPGKDRSARVDATSRATGVPATSRHHGKARGHHGTGRGRR